MVASTAYGATRNSHTTAPRPSVTTAISIADDPLRCVERRSTRRHSANPIPTYAVTYRTSAMEGNDSPHPRTSGPKYQVTLAATYTTCAPTKTHHTPALRGRCSEMPVTSAPSRAR